jgi:hypothetical protein
MMLFAGAENLHQKAYIAATPLLQVSSEQAYNDSTMTI